MAHFTQLVRSDHASKNAVEKTSQRLKQAELAVDKAFTALMQSILERYHEEQVWSDKIRSVSTWASLIVLGANLVVFVGAIAFVEPWKRKRLVEGLEQRMTGMMTKVDSQLQTLSDQVGSLEPVRSSALVAAPVAVASNDGIPYGSLPEATNDTNHVAKSASADSQITAATSNTEAVPGADSPSPLYTLERYFATLPYGPQAFAWSAQSLDRLAPPSAERDLAAATAIGAVVGAVTVSLLSVIVSSVRH